MILANYQDKHDNYHKIFTPAEYMKFWDGLTPEEVSDPDVSIESRGMRFAIRCSNDFLRLMVKRHKSIKFHDLGCGPTLVNMLSAAVFPEVECIDSSEYLEQNREYLIQSVESEGKKGFDYTKMITTLNSMHVNRDNFTGIEYFQPLSKKFQRIIKCDMSLEDIFCGESIDWGSYDAIISTWTVAEAVPGEDAYQNVLKIVNRMLKIGGSFCLLDLIKQTFWIPGEGKDKLNTLPISMEFFENGLREAGFLIEETRVFYPEPTPFCDYERVACARATKIKNL